MSTEKVLVALAAFPFYCALVLVLWKARAPDRLMFVILAATLAVVPRQLTSSGPIEGYTGIAQSQPTISTYTIAIMSVFMILWVRRRLAFSLDYVPLLVYIVIATIAFWGMTSVTAAGIAQYALAVAALLVGLSLGTTAGSSVDLRRTVALSVLVVTLLQLVPSAFQLFHLDPFPLDPQTAELVGTRVHGTINHPNNLGKVLLLLAALVLPMIEEADRPTRKASLWGLGLCGLTIAMTVGRANMLAFAILVILYAAIRRLSGAGTTRRRWLLPVGVAVVTLPFLPFFIMRLIQDPAGGSRGHMTQLAVDRILSDSFLGFGPNNYVLVVGEAGRLTSLPVHNSYLLATAEIGLVGAILLFGPMLFRTAKLWRRRRESGLVGASATAFFSLNVAAVVVVATGWAMLATFVFPLWMFVMGYLLAGSARSQATGEHETQVLMPAERRPPTHRALGRTHRLRPVSGILPGRGRRTGQQAGDARIGEEVR